VNFDHCMIPHDPAASELRLRAQLPEVAGLAGESRWLLADLLARIAGTEAAQGKLTEARATLDEAEKVLLEPGLAPRAKIRFLLEEGRLFILMRTPSQARTRFSQAWALAVEAGEDSFTVDIARMMATIEPMKAQESWIRKAIEVAESSEQKEAKAWLGGLYSDLGWRLFDLRQYESALEAHQLALTHYQNRGSMQEQQGARWSVGRLLRQLGRLSEALAQQEALYLETASSGQPDGRVCEEVAECLHGLKKAEAAQIYFERAYRALSAEGRLADRHPLQLKRLKTLGKVE
jgi:tetratricopeptide (TPR) repeat protein